MRTVQLAVKNFTGGAWAFASADGYSIYKSALQELEKGNEVHLSFAEIEVVTPKFLKESVARVLRASREKTFADKFKVKDLNWQGQLMLNRIIDSEKRALELESRVSRLKRPSAAQENLQVAMGSV